ncbi:Yip1 family protein [Flagellimonas crocea]|uniref:Yip1 family protein n=1 Tax=Flagellimonas crocea TaxID=3067311 RepID=UPI00296E44DE|nr:Yip1 family protein [Muricauda sp. DH64]
MKNLFLKPVFIAVAILTIILFGVAGYHYELGYPAWSTMIVGMLIGIALLILLKVLLFWLMPLVKKIPIPFVTTILGGFLAVYLLRMYAFRWPPILFYGLVLFGFACLVLFVAGLWQVIKIKKIKTGAILVFFGIVLAFLGFYSFNSLEGDPYQDTSSAEDSLDVKTLEERGIENPSTKGNFEVDVFTYGSGTDQKRPEYAEGVKIKSPTVDASLLLPEWKGKKKKWREKFWGFGVDSFPLNARVYMPKGEGPFPMVMMVHGNHSMIDYSDAGYAYLGELLASRGIIGVSVDENFINAHWSGDFRGKEMPARGWLLLKHLEQWRKWNQDDNSGLANKVDMDNIVLVGHSRGGEAVSIAAAFNKLERFPDNGNQTFDFGFGIKGIVTIAPTDYRYNREIDLKDINYLSIQGAYDSDETSFWGMRPFHRLKFSEDFDGFKAGLYMNHANHGQFNSTWGRSDFGAPMKWLLNLKPLVSGEEQHEAAKVYVSAFAEAVLKGSKDYRPMFKNVDLAMDWLPKETYLSQYSDTDKMVLVDFENEMDVTVAGDGINLKGDNFKVWRETELEARDGGSQQNNALVLGWKHGKDVDIDSVPVYTITLPDTLGNFGMADTLTLSMAMGDISELSLKDGEKKVEPPKRGFNFSIQLKDSLGNAASVAIADENRLPGRIRSKFTKFEFLDKEMIGKDTEVQLKSCYVPISSFLKNNDSLKLDKLKSIQFIFNKDTLGIVVLDDIGFYQ